MSTAPCPPRVSGHDVPMSSVQICRILTYAILQHILLRSSTLLDGSPLSAKVLEELIAFYLESKSKLTMRGIFVDYRLRTKNEDAVQVDLQIRKDRSSSTTRNSIKVYRGDYTFTDGDLATELCQSRLIREASPPTGNIARDFLSEMLVLNSFPIPQCCVCDETCYKGAVLCHHCIVSSKLNLNQNNGQGSRATRHQRTALYTGHTETPLFVRPTCLGCRNRYRCPAYKNMATTRSGSMCKQIILVYRFSFEALSTLVHLAVETFPCAKDLLKSVVTANTCRMLQKCPRLHDLIEMYGVKKSVMKSWERHVDSNFSDDAEGATTGVACSEQQYESASLPPGPRRFKFVFRETREGDPIVTHQYVGSDLYCTEMPMRPAAEIMRADASWLYCCLAVAPLCPATGIDPDDPEPRYT